MAAFPVAQAIARFLSISNLTAFAGKKINRTPIGALNRSAGRTIRVPRPVYNPIETDCSDAYAV